MRVPFSWLKEYVAWQGTVEELARAAHHVRHRGGGHRLGRRPARPREPRPLRRGQGPHEGAAPQRGQAQRLHRRRGRGRWRRPPDRLRRPQLPGRGRRRGVAQRRRARERPQAQEGEPARRRERRHDDERAGAGLRGEEPGHRRAPGRLARRCAAPGLSAGERGGARARADLEPARLLQHLRHRPRGRGRGATSNWRRRPPPGRPPSAARRRPTPSPSRSPTPTCARATAPRSSAASPWATRRRGSRRVSRTPACGPSATSSM